ncbi:MAG TPA: OmpA family protein [Acidimicrobiales bacterium]
MRLHPLRLLVPFSLIVGGLAVGAAAAPAGATGGTNLLTETFQNSATTSSGWQMPVGSSGVCLTAGSDTSGTPIPDCGGGSPDAEGSGALQLTDNAGGAVGTVYNSVALPTSNGLDVTWDSYQFNGTSPGADGISFDLAAVNPADPVPPSTVGPSGGSLGYATDGGVDGVPYGYLGFGADVFGNFENSSFGGTACTPTTPAASESMGVRGPGNDTTGYCLISQQQLVSPSTFDDPSATSRTGLQVPEEVVINPSSTQTVTAESSGVTVLPDHWMFATDPLRSDAPGNISTGWIDLEGVLPTDPVGVNTDWLDSSGLPQELAFGWASSTGGSNEFHQINFLQAQSLTPSPSLALTNTDSDSGDVPANSNATITLTPSVPSGSAESEGQTVIVSDTLPSSLTPGLATGTDWTCTTTGQLVSCSYNGTTPIAPNTTLPSISITATASSTPGHFTNSADVSSSDAAPATATDSGTIAQAAQSIAFTNTPPVSPLIGATYTVAATGGASGNAVTFSVDNTSTSGCTVNSSTGLVTLTSPQGTCVIDANQTGDTAYSAATQVQQAVTSRTASEQIITFTNTAPTSPQVGSTYTVTAAGMTSSNPVTFTVDPTSTSGCTVNATTGLVTLSAPAGTCVIDANQSGSAEAQQSVTSTTQPAPPSATITSPSTGGTYSLGKKVTTTFSCADGAGAPGVSSCSDGTSTNGSGVLNTSSPGTFTYTVTATSKDGQRASTSIHYKVVAPSLSLIIYFANNSWALSAKSKSQLSAFASAAVRDHLTTFDVRGFASSTGPLENNVHLGTQRAQSAWTYLEGRFRVLGARSASALVTGYGGSKYNVRPDTAAGNRRTEITAS